MNGYEMCPFFWQVGRFGDKSLLDSAIDRVARDQYGVRHPVSLHVMEFGTRMYSAATGQKVLYYPYPQVLTIVLVY